MPIRNDSIAVVARSLDEIMRPTGHDGASIGRVERRESPNGRSAPDGGPSQKFTPPA